MLLGVFSDGVVRRDLEKFGVSTETAIGWLLNLLASSAKMLKGLSLDDTMG